MSCRKSEIFSYAHSFRMSYQNMKIDCHIGKSKTRWCDNMIYALVLQQYLILHGVQLKRFNIEYDAILNRVRNASILYVDETSINVQGKKHWIWTFTTPSETFVVIRNSRGTKVLKEVLTKSFKGTIVCDGWKPYAKFTKKIQRCWSHLLRESIAIA